MTRAAVSGDDKWHMHCEIAAAIPVKVARVLESGGRAMVEAEGAKLLDRVRALVARFVEAAEGKIKSVEEMEENISRMVCDVVDGVFEWEKMKRAVGVNGVGGGGGMRWTNVCVFDGPVMR
ncbi:hypothetical protein HK104_007756 [Borealophlyctis nickersoniae]|nr:hypothetical protein HK104_007756 [Borealophlyctis nickersoniae]